MNAATDAYARLLRARDNRPDSETLAKIEAERQEEELQNKIRRLRKSVA